MRSLAFRSPNGPAVRSSPASEQHGRDANASAGSYNYAPLCLEVQGHAIRILLLQPPHPDNPSRLDGKLIWANLASDSRPEYETISYHWQPSHERASIYLDGDRLEVPHAAYVALRRMRLQDRPRALWLDAICINQADVAERSRQVSMMHKIYAGGVRNLIYLGEDDDGSLERAVRDIDVILKHMRVETKNHTKLKEMLSADPRVTEKTGIPGIDRDAIIRFYSRR